MGGAVPMEERGQELREAITRLERRRHNDPVPAPLRGEILVYSAARRQTGATWQSIAQELGLSASGLQRWSARATGETRMRPVRIRRGLTTESSSTSPSPAGAIVLVSPRGFRLEGLEVSQALELLHSLG
jgi:hypothetical protein